MPRPPLSLAAHARGALRGARAGAQAVGVGRSAGSVALLRMVAEQLADRCADLRALAARWCDRYRLDPDGMDEETAAALEYLAVHHAPRESSSARGSGPLGRVLPVALVAFDSPRNLVSATFHIAALTHPHPGPAWAAVALNVALAGLVQGRRDFVPDVVEALRGNDVPPELLAAVRRVPVQRRERLPAPGLVRSDAVAAVEVALWLAYHEPLLARGLDWLAQADSGPDALGIAAGALLGARDGEHTVPRERLPDEAELAAWDGLAERLVGVTSPNRESGRTVLTRS